MVDPVKLSTFDNALASVKSATDTAAASNASAIAADASAKSTASFAATDFSYLQAQLDAVNAAGADIGLSVRVPSPPVEVPPVEVPPAAPATA